MPKRPLRAEDLLRFVFVGDPQISPDGIHILFAHKTITAKNKYLTHLFTVDLSSNTKQWTQGENSCTQGRWSPDGESIAFVSGREDPADQIYLLPASGGEARKLSNLPEGSVGEIRWSPSGTHIAFTFRELHCSLTSAAKKEREEKGLSKPPLEIDDIWYRLDGDGYFGMQRHKLYLLEVATGEHTVIRQESPIGSYSFDWSPSGTELAVAHTASKRPMAEPPNDQIWRVDLTGQAWKIEGLPKGEKGSVRWSPDGANLAYAGDVDEKDPWGTRNTKIYVVPADGGEVRCLTQNTDYCMAAATLSDSKEAAYSAAVEWSADSQHIFTQVGWHGETNVGRVGLDGSFKLMTEGRHYIGLGSVCRSGRRVAVIYGDPTHLPEVGVLHLGSDDDQDRDILTSLNAAFHDEVIAVEPEEIWLDSTDKARVHGWVMKPTNYHAPKRYASVLQVHGGPHAQYGWVYFHEMQLLAAEGYVVVYTNPRGSKGYGEAHCRAIQGDWGNKDWDDVQVVLRWMQHQSFIHPGQLGIMGGSYGGFMTNWAIGHTHDFKAAITDRCVSNMVSMAGNSDFPFNKDGYFKGVAWGSLEEIRELWRQSPLAYFEDVKTPTLIIHSEGDLRCNIEQSEQVFTALQQQGVESRFVRYPSNTSHGMSRSGPPDLRLHRLREITNWWKKHLGGC